MREVALATGRGIRRIPNNGRDRRSRPKHRTFRSVRSTPIILAGRQASPFRVVCQNYLHSAANRKTNLPAADQHHTRLAGPDAQSQHLHTMRITRTKSCTTPAGNSAAQCSCMQIACIMHLHEHSGPRLTETHK